MSFAWTGCSRSAALVCAGGVARGRRSERRRREALARFGDPAVLGRGSALPSTPGATATLWALRLAALAFGLVALARPQLGERNADLVRTGRDVLVLLDLSRSMLVTDAGGTRLDAAKRIAWDLAERERSSTTSRSRPVRASSACRSPSCGRASATSPRASAARRSAQARGRARRGSVEPRPAPPARRTRERSASRRRAGGQPRRQRHEHRADAARPARRSSSPSRQPPEAGGPEQQPAASRTSPGSEQLGVELAVVAGLADLHVPPLDRIDLLEDPVERLGIGRAEVLAAAPLRDPLEHPSSPLVSRSGVAPGAR